MIFFQISKTFLTLFFSVIFASQLAFSALANEDKQAQTTDHSHNQKAFEQCLFKAIKISEKSNTLAQIEKRCSDNSAANSLSKESDTVIELGALANRITREKRTAFDPYVITPHKMNYILPISINRVLPELNS